MLIDVKEIWRKYCKTKNGPQILAVLSASLSAVSSGTLFAFTSPAIPKLRSTYNYTIEEVSYLNVLPPLFMLVFSPVFCKLADKIGRKRTLLSTGVIHLTAWLITAFAGNIWVFYITRALYGAADACIFAALPAYLAEVTTPRMRNIYGNMFMIASFYGQFFVNCIGYFFSIPVTAFILSTIPVLFMIVFSLMPETPYYLIMVNEIGDAHRSLQRLRGAEDVSEESEQIQADVRRQLTESGNFKDLWTIESNRKAFMIAILSRGSYYLSGFVAIAAYSQYIFQESGGIIPNGIAAMVVAGIFCVVITFANIISDKLGRRKSMIISCVCCAITLLGESVYFYLQMYESVDLSSINWFPVVGLVGYSISFSIGIGIVPNLIIGEIFSTSIRKHATNMTTIVFSIYSSGCNKLFQVLMSSFGMWVPFLFFGVCCLANAVMSCFVVPETKGKTLEEIQQMLKRSKK